MTSPWKAAALACLLAAVIAVVVAMRLSWRAGEIEGPSALVLTPAGEVWLGVDQALWRIAPDGALREQRPLAALGLSAPPANLAHGPDGSIVASVRRDPTLHVLDATTMQPLRRVQPRWPAALAEHGGRAINFDFDAQGRVAIATGGGHAVALFDAQGAFVARTPADLYRFTNGLWWSPRGLWTTDTNRFTLRLLDGTTLQPLDERALGGTAGGSYLGPARARRGYAAEEPTVALIRFRNGMVEGQLTLLRPGQPPLDLPGPDGMQPRDMDWLGDSLLVSDGRSMSVRRWSAEGQALEPFGDAALRQRLQGLGAERASLRGWHRALLGVAAALFVLGLAAAGLAQRAQRRAAGAPAALDLSQLGTPLRGRWSVAKMNLRMNAALLVASAAMLALNLVPKPWLKATLGAQGLLVAAIGLGLVILVLASWSLPALSRRVRRLACDPSLEPAFNTLAMNWLQRQQAMVAGLLRPGERVLETMHFSPGMTWCLLTDQRLLVFAASLVQHRLARAHELGQVLAVSRTPSQRAPSLLGRLTNCESWLELTLADGTALSGALASTTLAERVAQRIEALSRALRGRAQPAPAASPALRVTGRRRWLVVASLLLPGSAHAWLRHGGPAAVLLGAFVALLLFFSGPMLWTLVEPYVAVGRSAAVIAVTLHVGLALLAAVDAWRLASAPDARLPRR